MTFKRPNISPFFKQFLIFIGIFCLFLGVIFLFRVPILRGIGNYLICEDEPPQVEVMFVLGACTFERATAAVAEYRKGNIKEVVPTGEIVSQTLLALGLDSIKDAHLSRIALIKGGMDSTVIHPLTEGTSTLEEAQAALKYCNEKKYSKIIVLTSKHHTRRAKKIFDAVFKDSNVLVYFRGSKPMDYDTDNWWKQESGLIFVNNEYLKLIYYKWKYGI